MSKVINAKKAVIILIFMSSNHKSSNNYSWLLYIYWSSRLSLSPPSLKPALASISKVPSPCYSDGCSALIYYPVKLNHVKLNPKFHKEWGQPISENNSPFEHFFFLWPEGKLSRVHWGYFLKTLWKLTHMCWDFQKAGYSAWGIGRTLSQWKMLKTGAIH